MTRGSGRFTGFGGSTISVGRLPAKTKKDKVQDKKINKLIRAQPQRQFGGVSPSTGVNLTNLAQYVIMNPIPEGDQIDQRQGQKIINEKLEFRAAVQRSTLAANWCRLVLLWDKQPNGLVPTAGTDVLQSITGIDMYNSPYQHDTHPNRFTVLKDIRFVLNDQFPSKSINFTRKINKRSTYNSGVGAVPVTGNLLLLYMSDSTTDPPVMNYFHRLHFGN